ncbi:unnamed protein product [marine sediment metagenome]|uniref:Uncharacterized protein n=1 Tax=marine sediment metagenome TaxID=412755 RepID=X1VMZ4_9ZZZZ
MGEARLNCRKYFINFIFWENLNSIRKVIKAEFLMSKIAVIVNYKRFRKFDNLKEKIYK